MTRLGRAALPSPIQTVTVGPGLAPGPPHHARRLSGSCDDGSRTDDGRFAPIVPRSAGTADHRRWGIAPRPEGKSLIECKFTTRFHKLQEPSQSGNAFFGLRKRFHRKLLSILLGRPIHVSADALFLRHVSTGTFLLARFSPTFFRCVSADRFGHHF